MTDPLGPIRRLFDQMDDEERFLFVQAVERFAAAKSKGWQTRHADHAGPDPIGLLRPSSLCRRLCRRDPCARRCRRGCKADSGCRAGRRAHQLSGGAGHRRHDRTGNRADPVAAGGRAGVEYAACAAWPSAGPQPSRRSRPDRALCRNPRPDPWLAFSGGVHLSAQQTLDAAHSQLALSQAALARAEAQLLGPRAFADPEGEPDACCVQILAPQSGIVLDVSDQSARFVQAGSPLLTIGDLDNLEVELDILSPDAVRVPMGARAIIERWGGENPLEARLQRIDPAAFTRVSALGIKEQRVRLRLDLLSPPQDRAGLGEGFRVDVRLIIWEADDLLQIPQAALFRDGDGWAAFTLDADRARKTRVEIGRQAAGQAEVLSGLDEGSLVVLYPPNTLVEGGRIVERD